MLSPHTGAGALPFSRSLPEGGALADMEQADEITVSAPNERVDLEALNATKARRKGAER